ncbi:MAG: FkbM family methyltransferase [Dysgonamonadaceae bacterium]|jgi:FkbM family methyltransferase|nr:FkbM family methyltransferase [Dysgonamonadaceae bacterium]
MIINRDYILQRINALIADNGTREQERKKNINLIQKTWRRFQSLLPQEICVYYGDLYKAYREYRRMHGKNKTVIHSNWIDRNFVSHCLENDFSFDTADYFSPEADSYIRKHIDDRIFLAFRGIISRPMNETELAFTKLDRKILSETSVKKQFTEYVHNGEKYYIQEFSSFLWIYRYGMNSLPEAVKESVKGRDFLDIGAFYGDSTLMLLDFEPRRIYAYEPVKYNYKCLLETIEKNRAGEKITAVNKGVGDRETSLMIDSNLAESSFLTFSLSEEKSEEITVATIDSECKDRNVGIIKMDIEGFEYYAVKGGLETIKRDRPLLLISIYHTGKDFFEIPPMLKSCVPEYRFSIEDTFPSSVSEKILVGYAE